jgi:hypothetical protein
MSLLSSAIHGTSFHVQDPSRAESVVPFGWGLAITGFREDDLEGPWLWVHAAIPTPAIWDWYGREVDLGVRLAEVSVRFDSSEGHFWIANLHVWAAGNRLANLDGLQRPQKPDSEFRHNFGVELPVKVTGTAINLSIGIEQPRLIVVHRRPLAPTFVFNEASANFVVSER